MKWLFRFNNAAHLFGLSGIWGDKARKEAVEVAEEQAIGCILLVVIGIILLVIYLVLHALGIVV